MKASQIKELATMKMEIGSHTHSHAYLDELNHHEIFIELSKSKDILEQIIGQRVHYLSCPGGRFRRSLARIAEECGYDAICTSIPGLNLKVSHEPVPFLERYIIKNDMKASSILKMITQTRSAMISKLMYHSKTTFRKLIGNYIYDYIWRKTRVRGRPRSCEY
jgi:peptidoglycan/xylan/chitin deacetylase (PgdA/CDA1 family)